MSLVHVVKFQIDPPALVMNIKFHPHALARLDERGATQDEAVQTIEGGEKFPAKFERTGFRRNFTFNGIWRGKNYATKQVEAYAAKDGNSLIVITVIVKYF